MGAHSPPVWMRTGDMGRIDGGFLFFTDRKKDYVRSRGDHISSFEIENAVIAHSEVSDVAARAANVGRGEGSLKLTVVLASGSTLTEEALCRWCVDHLPSFAVPRYIDFRQEPPKTPTSKVQKNVLRQEGVTSRTWWGTRQTSGGGRSRTGGRDIHQAFDRGRRGAYAGVKTLDVSHRCVLRATIGEGTRASLA